MTTNIDIAIGKSRKETRWKNKQTTWEAFVKRLATTHRTHETYAEYMASPQGRQAEIKDIGGFVGGYLNGGRRKAENVTHRQLITLDVDFAEPSFWADFQAFYDNAAALYSTHKHSPETPRLRLILPLDREVFTDEYEAIARAIAGTLGIEQFDHTTFEPTRLMYWPSTSADGEYVFEQQDGPWLSADAVLATYRNWRDASEWPVSARFGEVVQRSIKKQGDPLEKPGIVGAFCRTYTIAQAIETYLPDTYTPTDIPGRWTYTNGSTAGGLVVYDDLYAYSHHGTDPASGKLCNAFDLVRLHRFGLQDEDTSADTPINKHPSYLAMQALATDDRQVRLTLGAERLAEARHDFAEPVDEAKDGEPINNEWMGDLSVDRKGQPVPTISNIVAILNNDPNLRGKFTHNAFTGKDIITGHLPWRRVVRETRYMTDVDLAGVRDYLENTYDIANASKTADALALVLYNNRFHPVRDYLDSVAWDGEKRLDTVLIDYLGAEDSAYVRAVTRKTLVAAVTRVMRPGCKFDYVLTLVGKQGAGKSTIIRKLGREWYCENLTTVQGKEAAEQLQGVWLMEMGELAGLKKAEVEIIKNFISRQEDSYRPAYAIKKETYPRQCVFIGTTNNRDFLRDPTGNRRFWPVDIGVTAPRYSVHSDLDAAVIGQIWAEAVRAYEIGEDLYLDDGTEALARDAQEGHVEVDSRTGLVEHYLQTLLPERWDEMNVYERRQYLAGGELAEQGTVARTAVSVAEVWCECFGGQQKDMNTNNTKPIHAILEGLKGWQKSASKRWRKPYGKQIIYEAKNVAENRPK